MGRHTGLGRRVWHSIWMIVGFFGLLALALGCAGQPTTAPIQPSPIAQPTSVSVPPTKALTPTEQALAAVKGLSGAEREQRLLEGAKKEGAGTFYTSINAVEAQGIVDAFNKKYEGVNLKFFRASSSDLFTKAVNEARAGQNLWDAMDIASEYVYSLDQEGILASYDIPMKDQIPDTLRDANGKWTSLYINANVASWNTKLVKPEDAPKKYQDFLDPKWKGKISLDISDYSWAYYILKTMGQEQGMDFLTKLAAQKPQMIQGRSNQNNMLEAGEVSASVALFDFQQIGEQKKGAPIGLAYIEPVRLENEPIMLAKNAQHPYAALLFLDWALGNEGQSFIVKLTNRISVRKDVPPQNEIQGNVLKGKYVLIPLDEVGRNLKDIQQMFNKTFGLK